MAGTVEPVDCEKRDKEPHGEEVEGVGDVGRVVKVREDEGSRQGRLKGFFLGIKGEFKINSGFKLFGNFRFLWFLCFWR